MSEYLAIVADIAKKYGQVAAAGKVYDYDRRVNTEAGFVDLFTIASGNKKEILGWEITRVQVRETKNGQTFMRHHRFRVAGYKGLQDAEETDKDFQVLIDTICAKFRVAEPEAGDAAPWFYMDGLNPSNSCIQVEVIDQRMFGAYLCHHADIYITVTERIIA